ncbi:MAG TPA: hypothetical protein VLA43_05670 [Longimicrobiales bacterium]|nr:hypothetical protein [Longimicrobiales bacterium]
MDHSIGSLRREPRPCGDPFLRLLVLQQGRAVECSATGDLRQFGGAYFVVSGAGAVVSEPFPDLPALFTTLGRPLVQGAGGRVLEWEGLILSEDAAGEVAGPYPGFDEWVWNEGETVSREEGPTATCMSWGGRYIHHWRGLYFLTVDPLPTCGISFTSLEGARRELLGLSYLALKLQDG